MLLKFLNFLLRTDSPETRVAFTQEMVDRVNILVEDVEIDLDKPLLEENE